MRASFFFFIGLLMSSWVLGNAGPPIPDFFSRSPSYAQPYPPEVYVRMQVNGTPDTSITKITYHCEGSNSTDTGIASQRILDFPCTGGECSNTNVEWFYRYNTCFNFHSGFFSYELEGKKMQSKTFTFPEMGRSYYITIDSKTGEILSAKKYAADQMPCPLTFFILFVALAALIIRSR